MEVSVRIAQESDIDKIKLYINEYGLDNEDLDYRQFYIAEINNEIAGFGRIKQYGEVFELATIGVIEKYRGNGIGKKIIKELIEFCNSEELWLTTIIPEYFEQFGFVKEDFIPDEILFKSQRVCSKFNKTTQNSSYMRYRKPSF